MRRPRKRSCRSTLSTLRSATQGKAEFTMEFSRYLPVPQSIGEELVAKHNEKEKAAAGKKGGAHDATADKVFAGGVSLKVTASAGKPLKDLKPGDQSNVEITVASGGTDYLDVRYVGGCEMILRARRRA